MNSHWTALIRTGETVRSFLRGSSHRGIGKYFAGFISLVWVLFVAGISLLPKETKVEAGDNSHLHQAEHILTFALTTYLLLSLSKNTRKRVGVPLAVFALAFTLETLQYLAVPRAYAVFEWWDLRDDLLGILLAWLVFTLVSRYGKAQDRIM